MAHPRRFRFAIELQGPLDGRSWADSARWAEDAGYSTVFVPDHLDEGLGPIAAMTAAATATTRLHVGSLVLAADIVGRIVIRPGELPVGIVTAFVGAPVLILLVRRKRASGL